MKCLWIRARILVDKQPEADTACAEKGVRPLKKNLRTGITHSTLMVTSQAPKYARLARVGWVGQQ